MYAVIQTGGKQYRVAVGDRLKVETLGAEPGENIELDKVLLVSDDGNVQVGAPVLEGTSVSAQVIGQGRGDKIKVFKLNRRQGYRRTQGHRQNYTELEITAIGGKGAVSPDSAAEKPVEVVESAHDSPAQEGTADDLTRINGIGPVLSEKLEKLGYTTFAQLAELDEAAIGEINEKLDFKGRIEREEWVEQARALVE